MDIRKFLPRKRPSEELDPDCVELDENMSDTELPDTVPILLPSSSGSQNCTKAVKKSSTNLSLHTEVSGNPHILGYTGMTQKKVCSATFVKSMENHLQMPVELGHHKQLWTGTMALKC